MLKPAMVPSISGIGESVKLDNIQVMMADKIRAIIIIGTKMLLVVILSEAKDLIDCERIGSSLRSEWHNLLSSRLILLHFQKP